MLTDVAGHETTLLVEPTETSGAEEADAGVKPCEARPSVEVRLRLRDQGVVALPVGLAPHD